MTCAIRTCLGLTEESLSRTIRTIRRIEMIFAASIIPRNVNDIKDCPKVNQYSDHPSISRSVIMGKRTRCRFNLGYPVCGAKNKVGLTFKMRSSPRHEVRRATCPCLRFRFPPFLRVPDSLTPCEASRSYSESSGLPRVESSCSSTHAEPSHALLLFR